MVATATGLDEAEFPHAAPRSPTDHVRRPGFVYASSPCRACDWRRGRPQRRIGGCHPALLCMQYTISKQIDAVERKPRRKKPGQT